MLYPLTFQPIFKERIWGGRNLERLYHKQLPPKNPIGESWEVTDRPEGISVISTSSLAGRDLSWLMQNHLTELLGTPRISHDRFPLLVKILDAQETLSLQVHPPDEIARRLGGEPKTEMWYIAHATPEAKLYVGLKRGVTRRQFEEHLRHGTVADCFHELHVRPGDAMFLPSGRVHAIGAGNVIFEIQQNSDTTYRVFDWNRLDASGKPRDLHVQQSLDSIDFTDFEPGLISAVFQGDSIQSRTLVEHALFTVKEYRIRSPGAAFDVENQRATIFAVLTGNLTIESDQPPVELSSGQFCLVPASVGNVRLSAKVSANFLETVPG